MLSPGCLGINGCCNFCSDEAKVEINEDVTLTGVTKAGYPVLDHLQLAQGRGDGGDTDSYTRHGTTDWFKIWKVIHQGCILSPCLFILYAQYIMWNARLDEAQTGIKIAARNTNNLRYADDTTLKAESDEELKSLLMKVKEES